jgi:glutamate 5-kinase
MRESRVAKRRRWVVKAGSQMVCAGGPLLMRVWMQQVAALRKKHNIEIIWVTSGAIAWAMEKTSFKKIKDLYPKNRR